MLTIKFKSGGSQSIRVSSKFFTDTNGERITPAKCNEKAKTLAEDIAGKDLLTFSFN